MDVLRYLDSIVDAFIIVQEIECTLRTITSLALPSEDKLQHAIKQSLSDHCENRPMPLELEEMTFGDLVSLICDGRNWMAFDEILGVARKRTYKKLKKVRDIRNKHFHFREDISEDEREYLLKCRNWLRRCCRKYQSRDGHVFA